MSAISLATALGSFGLLPWSLLHLLEQGLQHDLGVARHAQRHGDVLVDVGGIERRLDDLDARRHLDAEVGLRERAADAEDQVRLVEEGAHRLRDGEAARAERQRMRLGKGALAAEAGRHRNGQQLGQLLELAPGLGPMHARAGVDHRPLGGDQHLGRFADGVGVGAGADRLRAHVVLGIALRGPQVVRHLDQHRAATARAQALEGAPHHVRQLLGRRHRLGRLGDVLHGERGEEVAVDPGHALGVAHGHHEDRHGLAVGLGDAAVGVLGAGAVLHHEHADLLAGGDARDGVRHVQADALLAHDDGADVGGGAVLEDVVDGIADDPLHAFALQDFCNRIAGFHGGSSALADRTRSPPVPR